VGIAEEPPRQLAPFVGSATTGFCHLGGILHHQQSHPKIMEFLISNFIWRAAEFFARGAKSGA
jgi:hypothetical protein